MAAVIIANENVRCPAVHPPCRSIPGALRCTVRRSCRGLLLLKSLIKGVHSQSRTGVCVVKPGFVGLARAPKAAHSGSNREPLYIFKQDA